MKKTSKKSALKKALVKKAPAKQAPAKRAAPNKAAAKKAPAKKAPAKKPAPRADFGQPIDGFFAKQSPTMRPLLDKLRSLVDAEIPNAESSLKWGMPFYSIDGVMTCALAGHKAHVNFILAGPPGTFKDPDGLLEGDGKTGRRLVLRAGDQIPEKAVRGWLKAAAELAKSRA